MSEPREWVSAHLPSHYDEESGKLITANFHVIEKSAYDWQKAQARNYDGLYQTTKFRLEKLQAQAEKLADALEKISSGLTTDQSRVEMLTKNLAQQALADFRGEK